MKRRSKRSRSTEQKKKSRQREKETEDKANERRKADRIGSATARDAEKEEKKNERREQDRISTAAARKANYTPMDHIAVNVKQSDFKENLISDHLKTSYLGSIYQNKCHYCKAYKFNGETNFCCLSGQIMLDPVPEPPEELCKLYQDQAFTKNIRGYNNSLAMASVGCNIPSNVQGPQFKIQGKVHHAIGSLIPVGADTPKFLQLYFYDNTDATNFRLQKMSNLDPTILEKLTGILTNTNTYIHSFKAAMELVKDQANVQLVLLSDKTKIPEGQHERTYNLPTGSEVAALLPEDKPGEYDVIVNHKADGLKRISQLHRSYDPLQYVVMFPFGTDGYHLGLKKMSGKSLSPSEFYSYRIQARESFNIILRSKRLFQQYLVDQAAKVENERMKWVLLNQKSIKADKYKGLLDASTNGDLANAGTKMILPPTITGCPRWYAERFQDAMCIVRNYGKPHLFITFTCNPAWPEITESLNPGETAFDRPDIMTRVFILKHKEMMNDIEKGQIFGKVKAFVYTLEQQKRMGLHHTHTLVILESESAPRTPEDIDKFVSAEIPDPVTNPILFAVICKHNIHGPCGKINVNSPCMDKNDKGACFCKKNFPKDFQKETSMTEYSYPTYQRRSILEGGRTLEKFVRGKIVQIDNSFVVPYNSFLSLKYDAHINVEFVGTVLAVKYLYKYLTKVNSTGYAGLFLGPTII